MMGVEADIAGDAGSSDPENGVRWVEIVSLHIFHEILGDNVQWRTLPGIVPEAPAHCPFGWLQEPGIPSGFLHTGHDQAKTERIPVREENRLFGQIDLST